MKILAIAISLSFLSVIVASEAQAARMGTMSGIDNTHSSQKGHKCVGGNCVAPKKKK